MRVPFELLAASVAGLRLETPALTGVSSFNGRRDPRSIPTFIFNCFPVDVREHVLRFSVVAGFPFLYQHVSMLAC